RGARGAAAAAAHAGTAGAAPPGPARRQRPCRAARAVARDRPETAPRRAGVRRRADRALAGARPLAYRRALPLRPARLGAGPRSGTRPRLDDRPDRRLGIRRRAPADARRDRPLAARSFVMLRAVLFDVDFTIARPGPELGPEGYRGMGGDADSAYECAVEMTRAWEHAEHFELFEDARPVLDELRAQGLKLGLVSNTGRDLDAFVAHHHLQVDAALGSGAFGRTKPHPTIFREV